MNALIVGFGGMGCRHAQSLVSSKKFKIYTIESSDLMYTESLKKTGLEEKEVIRISESDLENIQFDFAIVATSSSPRFEIVKKLLNCGIKYFLLEKIVFQSRKQFDEIIELQQNKGAKIYCNFVNRYYKNYTELKQFVKQDSSKLRMNVYGGDFGLGCNSVHYFDLFEYLAGEPIQTMISNIEISNNKHKRGDDYKEFWGNMYAYNSKGSIHINFDPSNNNSLNLLYTLDSKQVLVNEITQNEVIMENQSIVSKPFEQLRSSYLTAILAEDIMNDKCTLTTLQETYNIHSHLFTQFNSALNQPNEDTTICPIT